MSKESQNESNFKESVLTLIFLFPDGIGEVSILVMAEESFLLFKLVEVWPGVVRLLLLSPFLPAPRPLGF